MKAKSYILFLAICDDCMTAAPLLSDSTGRAHECEQQQHGQQEAGERRLQREPVRRVELPGEL